MLYNFRISFEIKILAVKVNKSQLSRTKICCDYEQLQDGPTAVTRVDRWWVIYTGWPKKSKPLSRIII